MDTFDIRPSQIKDALLFEEQLEQAEQAFINVFYNYPNLIRAIETSCMAFTISSDSQTIEGIAIFDYEPVHSTHIVDDCYQLLSASDSNLTPFNSIFMSILILKSLDAEQYQLVFNKIALNVFSENSNIETIVFLDERNDAEDSSENPTALRQFLNNSKAWDNLGMFKTFRKSQVVPILKFRKAREEDQDDLAIVCNAQTNLTTNAFGDFFIAEMISSQKEENLCLVAESQEYKAVGMAVVSSDINYEVLIDNFDLSQYSFCIKSDFYEAYHHQMQQLEQLRQSQKAHQAKKYKEEIAFYKTVCSKNWLMLEMQEFCGSNKMAFVNDFQPILNDQEKQKTFNKNLLKRKLDKLLKGHKISSPNEVFSRELDYEVYTCTMSATDLLLETLRMFDLPIGYLDGEGHWSFWLKRKQEERNEEARQKDILGKKKAKLKKNKFSDNKENQLITPQWFDIEPFYVAFQHFTAAQSSMRKKVCEIINENKHKILSLFCADNGELIEGRTVDITDIIESIAVKSEGAIDESFQQLMVFILFCFGNLEFDQEIVTFQEQLKSKSGKTKDKSSQRTLRKVSFKELMAAVSFIISNEEILEHRQNYIDLINQKHEQMFLTEAHDIISKSSCQFDTNHYLPGSFTLSLNRELVLPNSLRSVPEELKNAVCWNIFFIDKRYEESSNEFLIHIFDHFNDREYLLITLPHNTPHFKLLENFVCVPPKSSSNFNHTLYLFHKANILNYLTSIELLSSKDVKTCKNSSTTFASENKVTQIEFRVTLKNDDSEDMMIGHFKAFKSVTAPQLKQEYHVGEIAYSEAFNKNEVLEIREFELHHLFKSIERFVLREALRLSKCRILVVNQKNAALIPICSHFYAIKKVSSPTLVLHINKPELFLQDSGPSSWFTNTLNFERVPLIAPKAGAVSLTSEPLSLHSSLSLCIPKLLSLKRLKFDARIIVLGASSCALSFIESLLNHRQFDFSSIYLVSETFDWEPHIIETKAKKMEHLQNAFSVEALLNRIAVICGKMIFLDRKTNRISIKTFSGQEFNLEYDYLIFANSLEEKTYENLSEKKSQGELLKKPKLMFSVDKLNTDLYESLCSNNKLPLFVDINQNSWNKDKTNKFSADFTKTSHEYADIRHLLADDNDILSVFRGRKNWFERITQEKNPMQVVLYGFSIEILIVMEQLISRWKIQPSSITLVIPRKIELLDKETSETNWENFDKRLEFFEKLTETPTGLNQALVREFYIERLIANGINVLRDYEISDFSYSENNVTLKTTHPTSKEKSSNTGRQKASRFSVNPGMNRNFEKNPNLNVANPNNLFASNILNGHNGDSPTDNNEGEELVFENCLFITGDFYDISHQTFRTIQENGLVYNGRLIVQSNFQTIDEKIFGAGKICEFSQRYKNSALGRSLRMDKYNQKEIGQKLAECFVSRISGEDQSEDLPTFNQAVGMAAYLAYGFFIVDIDIPFQGKTDFGNKLTYSHNNLLDGDEEEFVSMGFDQFGILKRFFYFGHKALQMDAVSNLIGLHRNYFNNFFKHNERGLVRSFIDFMNEGWAKAVFHPSFSMFKRLMSKLATGEKRECSVDISAAEGIQLLIEEGLVDFVMEHKSLLEYYYIPNFKIRSE